MPLENLEEFWADIRPNRLPQPIPKEPYSSLERMCKGAYDHARKNPGHILTFADDVPGIAFGFACKTCSDTHAGTLGSVLRRGTFGDLRVVPEFSWECRARDIRPTPSDNQTTAILKRYMKEPLARRALLEFFHKGHLKVTNARIR